MRKLLALLLALWAGPAFAQSSPGWVFGFVPTPAQWNAEWSTKLDYNPSGLTVPAGGTGQVTFTANAPLIGAGTSAIAQGTRSGNTTIFGTTSGALTSGHCVQIDASGNLVDAGGVCTTGGGGGTVTSGTANNIAYYATTGTAVTGLANANNSILATNGAGLPALTQTLPTGTLLTNATGLPLAGLVTIGANTVVSNWTGSTAAAVANTMPVCTTAQELIYTAGTGFVCGSASPLNVIGSGFTSNATLAARNAVTANVQLDFGAKCDGSTDDTSAFTAAFATAQTVIVPSAACVSSSGFTVPAGRTLQGTSFSAGNPIATGTSIIECPSSVSHCVTLGNGSTNDTSVVRNISILGTGGTPTGTSNGLYVNGEYNVVLDTVNVQNFQYLYHIQGYPATGAGISLHADKIFGGKAGIAYVWQDSWPELYIDNSRFGMDGTGDYTGVGEFFLISGGNSANPAGGPNTLVVANSQMNQGAGSVNYGVSWLNCAAGCVPTIDGTTWKFFGDHFEGLALGLLHSDSSWNTIQRLQVYGITNNSPSAPCLVLNAATTMEQSSWHGNLLFCTTFTLASTGSTPLNFDNFIGNYFNGTFTLNPTAAASTVAIQGNTFVGAVSISGIYGSLSLQGDYYGVLPVSFSFPTGTSRINIAESNLVTAFSGLPTCNSGARIRSITVTDGATTYNVGTAIAGGGSTQVEAACANGTWVAF